MALIIGNNTPEGAPPLLGGIDKDTIEGRQGGDTIDGGAKGDDLFGQSGADLIFGENGGDSIEGGNNDDELYGGNGNDTLDGGNGDDELNGRAGFDQLEYIVDNTSAAGNDTIFDFIPGEDVINLGTFGTFADLDTNGDNKLNNQDTYVTKIGDETTIDVGAAFGFAAGTETLLIDVDGPNPNRALDVNDFIFVA